MRRQRAVSVGRRLAALVGVQVATAAVLLAVAFGGYGRLASDLTFLHRYVLARIEGISDAMEEAAQLKFAAEAARNTPPDLHEMKGWARDVRHFLDRYRTEWAVAGNTSEDALRFHATLERANRGGLAAEETAAMNDVGSSLARVEAKLASPGFNGQVAASIENDARDLRTALRRLLRVQVAFIDVENAATEGRSRETYRWMSVVGLLGLFGSLALGLQVHQAIAPRIRRLVQEVQRFKELGVHQRVLEEGRDEIAILANARSGALPFRPQSVDAACVALKVAAEVAVTMPGRSFDVDVARGGRLLADEHLLTQAVWTLLTYAAAIAETGRKILVRLVPGGARLRLEVLFDAPSVPAEEMERAFAPFASVQYEGGSAIRNAVGLFLCREVARVHGGSLFALNPTDVQRMLVLELPA